MFVASAIITEKTYETLYPPSVDGCLGVLADGNDSPDTAAKSHAAADRIPRHASAPNVQLVLGKNERVERTHT